MSIDLAVIGGDGIGPEVVAEALKVLDAVVPDVRPTSSALGATAYHRTGEALPDSVLEELKGHDAILLGAVGDPSVPPGVLERGLLLRLRFALDHHVNLRPVRLFPGVTGPVAGPVDMVVVREGTEGPYVGNGGARGGGGAAPCGAAGGGRNRGEHQHGVRCGARRAGCLPPGPGAAAAPDPGAQDERA